MLLSHCFCVQAEDILQQGDVVRVSNEIALVHTLQEDHGGWVDDMVLVCRGSVIVL